MEPIDSKCYHVGGNNGNGGGGGGGGVNVGGGSGGITTVNVGTQSSINGCVAIGANNSGTCNGVVANNNNGNGNNNSEQMAITKSKAQNSGNYLNIVPMPMGVQYHPRRKYSPQIQSDYQSSRIFFSGAGDYVSRERYALASTPIPLSDVESMGGMVGAGMPSSHNSSGISSPLSISVQQQTLQQSQQSPLPQPSNVPSVLYTVQRVITTSQIQTSGTFVNTNMTNINEARGADMMECNAAANPNLHLANGGNACSNGYTSQGHQIMSHSIDTQTPMGNCYGATQSNTSASISRPLQEVIPMCVYLMSRVAVHMEIEGTVQCPTQVILAAALGCEELGIANKLLAQSIFGLWMTSPLLEIQLKAHNRPFSVRTAWTKLLHKYSNANALLKKYDEPMIQLRRSVFVSKRDEEKMKDPRIIELLYEEARHNVLNGRYILEPAHSIMLGGIQARIELGPFNVHTHTISYFRENQFRFLPHHVARNSNWSWMPYSRKTSAEVKLLEQYKRVPTTATTRKLMRKYLEFCWALPFYGAAFFHAQVEQPVRGLMSLFQQKDVSVLVAINERGVFIIDNLNSTLLLGLKYEELSWDFAKPSAIDDPDCLPCIFIQFDAVENGMNVSRMMQIFSKQAPMMDALISHFAEQMRRRREGDNGQPSEMDEPNPIQSNGNGVLSNKLSRLTLATFDDDGRCIGQMGSLSISY